MLIFVYAVLAYVAVCLFLVSEPIVKKQLKRRFGTINQIAFVKSPDNKSNIKRMKVVRILVTVFIMTYLYCGVISLFHASMFTTILAPIALLCMAVTRIYHFFKIRKIVIDYKEEYPFSWIKTPKFKLYIGSLIVIIILCIILAIIGPMVITQISSEFVNNVHTLLGS